MLAPVEITASAASAHGDKILAVSMATIAIGPLLHAIARRERVTLAALDSFVLVAVLGLAILEILPGAIALAGWLALLAAAVGLLGPMLAEGPLRLASRATHHTVMTLAILGMIGHAFTDGVALAGAHIGGDSHGIEIAIIAHQLPVAMAVWWLIRPTGLGRATLALSGIAAATFAGFTLAEPSLQVLSDTWKGMFQALVGGLLLHVISHHAPERTAASTRHLADAPARERLAARLGTLAGLGLLSVFLTDAAAHEHAGVTSSPSARALSEFLALARESAPALLLAFGLAGIVGALLPAASVRWLSRGRAGERALRGMAFGLPLPLCSCGVVPVYRSLVRRGVPAASGLAFLVATPELGLDALIFSIPLLGGPMTLMRVLGAALVALCIGWLVGGHADRLRARADATDASNTSNMLLETAETERPRPLTTKLREGLRIGLVEMVDSTGPWILVGLVLAALLSPALDAGALTRLDPLLQVALFAVLGIPIYVCASGATPLVAVLIAKGLSPGAALAFLLTGPATNATTFGVLSQLHGRRVGLRFAIGMVTLALALGYVVDLAIAPTLPQLVGGVAAGAQAAEHAHHGAHPLETGALLALGALFVTSFVRQGPRGFLHQLRVGAMGHDHEDAPDESGCCQPDAPSCCGPNSVYDHPHDPGSAPSCCGPDSARAEPDDGCHTALVEPHDHGSTRAEPDRCSRDPASHGSGSAHAELDDG